MKVSRSRLGIPRRVYAKGGPYPPRMQPMPTRTGRAALASLLVLSLIPSGPAAAQAQQPAPQQIQFEIGDLLAACEQFPPKRRVGMRAHFLREAQMVADTVVIVDSPEAATAAIGMWRGLFRFPVLIDDGSLLAAENIARFVRAFGPSRVIRWTPSSPVEWPTEVTARARRLMEVLGRTIKDGEKIESMRGLVDHIRSARSGPQGVVAIDPSDPAWIAGLALAAGRVQPMVFFENTTRVNQAMSGTEMRNMAELIQNQLRILDMKWGELGDEIDALTVVANTALRVGLGQDGDEEKALTDLLGRHRGGIGNRWAWAGAVFGDSQTALYRAMCGLFIPAESVWLFDGYGRGDPWDLFDATIAGRMIAESALRVEVHDVPANRVSDWRRVTGRGLNTDLIMINSKGNMNFFDLVGEKAWCGDIPLLDRPAAMHIVHSWSARVPSSPRTVAGRWLERGVYAYYGSIDEPFLQAFVPTPQVAVNLLAGMPFGVAVRHDSTPPWKLNVLGDPLVTFIPDSKAGRRIGPELPFSPLESPDGLDEIITSAIRESRFGEALRSLTLAGRDEDAARLATALMRDKPEAFGNEAALWSVLPLYRTGRYDALAAAYSALSPESQKTLILQDALWHAGRIMLRGGPDTRVEGLMRRNLRVGQEEHDAIEIAERIASRAGPGEAVHFLEGVVPDLPNERRQQPILTEIRRYGGGIRP